MLEIAKKAVEIAIERDEKESLGYIRVGERKDLEISDYRTFKVVRDFGEEL